LAKYLGEGTSQGAANESSLLFVFLGYRPRREELHPFQAFDLPQNVNHEWSWLSLHQ
jgi:hypothetical protein